MADIELAKGLLHDLSILSHSVQQTSVAFVFKFLSCEGLDRLIVHDRLIQDKLGLFLSVFALFDLNASLVRESLAEVGVETQCDCCRYQVLRSTVEAKHATEKDELDGDWCREA